MISGPTWREPSERDCKAGSSGPANTASRCWNRVASCPTEFSIVSRSWAEPSLSLPHCKLSGVHLRFRLHLQRLLPLAAVLLPFTLRAQGDVDSAPVADPELIIRGVQLQRRDIFD